jgi:hypothetical protein
MTTQQFVGWQAPVGPFGGWRAFVRMHLLSHVTFGHKQQAGPAGHLSSR